VGIGGEQGRDKENEKMNKEELEKIFDNLIKKYNSEFIKDKIAKSIKEYTDENGNLKCSMYAFTLSQSVGITFGIIHDLMIEMIESNSQVP
jgi:hemerythrin superfamily protein